MSEARKELKATKGESAGELASIALNAVPLVGGVMAALADSYIDRRQIGD